VGIIHQTEELSLTGISNKMNKKINNKISKLKKILNEHINMQFPEIPRSDDLADINTDLSHYGGHVVGLVTSYLNNASVNPKLVEVDYELENKLEAFEPNTQEEKQSLNYIVVYKHKLDELVTVLNELI
jgi:hypothetical protein